MRFAIGLTLEEDGKRHIWRGDCRHLESKK